MKRNSEYPQDSLKEKTLRAPNYRVVAIAVLLGTGTMETLHIGQREATVAERYDETLRQARTAYQKRREGAETFERFLSKRGIPTPDEVEALERLIAEFDKPVTIRSGFSIIQCTAFCNAR